MTNLYHVFYKMPILHKEDMYVGLEELSEQLVNSGLFRIDAEPKQNFTRFSIPSRNLHVVFSKRELYEEHLQQKTYNKLRKILVEAGESGDLDQRIANEIAKLKTQLKKHLDVEPELEMQLARILVQSAHPVVFSMIILEQVQVFLSYGHNIGEVMDIVSWTQAGSNSGMQSTDGKNVAIFVSCGGDPLNFDPPESDKDQNSNNQVIEEKTAGDGTPALARMMGIAGQETGHYSDIQHDRFGRQVSRFSANFSGTRADPTVNLARLTDMKNIETYLGLLRKIGLYKLIDLETTLQFFDRQPHKDIYYHFKRLRMKIFRLIFSHRAGKIKFWPIKELKHKKYLGISLQELFGDMAFNLAPVADVYSHEDKNVETAIACIEALARVPQQVNKWGHANTLFFWRNLYKFYYYKVIPRCIKDYENISGKKFTLYPHMLRRYSMIQKLIFKIEIFKNKLKQKFSFNKK